MAKYLRYIVHDFDKKTPADLFPSGADFIFSLFEIELGKTPSDGISKLVVNYTADKQLHLTVENLLGVLVVQFYFNRGLFASLDLEAKKKYYLDSILATAEALADSYGWNRQHFREVHQRILSQGIVFDRWWGKPVRHKATGRNVQAHVKYYDAIQLSVGLFDRSKRLITKRQFAPLPGLIGAVHDAFGKLTWVNENVVRLWHSNERDFWEWNIAADEIQFHYPRAERGDPHGEYDLGRLYLEGRFVPPNSDLAMLWLNSSAEKGFKHAIKLLDNLKGETPSPTSGVN